MAAGVLRTMKAFWSFLADPSRQDETNVVENLLLRVKPPARTRVEVGAEGFDPDDEGGDVPPEIEIGRVLAIARQGYFPKRVDLGR